MGLGYLLSCCCCCHLAGDPGADGTGRGRKSKRDPREDIVDQQFQSRVYTRDDTGRIHVQPAPGSTMVSLNGSPIGGGTMPRACSPNVSPGEGLPAS
ncbi:hypothetical protein BDZ89DRAFT_116550 [Hymenopellis radicata]|nr:hypothetical protein BDZ89DRAFT_116550 [Hymenopellis radicata]